MAGVIKAGVQRGQPFVPHQHEVAHLGLVPWRPRIEAGRAIFDGIDPIARDGLAGRQGGARERLGREALHRIAVNRLDDGVRHDGLC
jgi:hypothetical protein